MLQIRNLTGILFILSQKGELYKSTGSFTTAFFVSSCFVLVGVSLIYIVQRIRPDLVRKPEPARREEVIPSPSIHSASVVDTLSGMCVTDPNLSLSHLDPVEVGSYQRFDSFRREDSRPIFLEPVQGRLASKSEIEAVYKQAIDNMSNTGGKVQHPGGSDATSSTKSNVPVHFHSASVHSDSVSPATKITGDFDSSSGLQTASVETHDGPKTRESCDTLANDDVLHLKDDRGIKIPGDGSELQQGDKEMCQTGIHGDGHSVTSEIFPIATSPTKASQTTLEANDTDQHVGSVVQLESDISVPLANIEPLQVDLFPESTLTKDITDAELEEEIELVKILPPPESHRRKRTEQIDASSNVQNYEEETGEDDKNTFKPTSEGASEQILDIQIVASNLHGETVQDSDGSAMPFVDEKRSSENVDVVEETQDVDEVLGLVRIPPPPSIPRTGQLVALEIEEANDFDQRNVTSSEIESSSVSHASLSEIKLDACQNDFPDKGVVDDNSFSKEGSYAPRKERLHLAVIDQLNLLSERLEAVAARQVQEEEEELENGEAPDQRPVFSPALQSLPLTPLYSANHSIPLTPVRAWPSSVNTPGPTPLQTPPSAFHTTAPTPIPTSRAPSQSLSGVFNAASDMYTQTPCAINVQDSNDVFEVCSPSASQDPASRRRSRCSSFSEVGQEFILNEWSHLDLRNNERSTEAFSSKISSDTNSSISTSARSEGELNSVSDPIDIGGDNDYESHGAHLNSPENYVASQELESSTAWCLPQQPYLQSPNTGNPFQQTYLDKNPTELLVSQRHRRGSDVEDSNQQKLPMEVVEGEHSCNEVNVCLPQQTTCQQFDITNNSKENQVQSGPMEIKQNQVFNNHMLESTNIVQPSPQGDFAHNDTNTSSASEPEQGCLPTESRPAPIAGLLQQFHVNMGAVESKLIPFLDLDRRDSIDAPHQYPLNENEICPSVGAPDGSQNGYTSDLMTVSTQQTRLDPSPVNSTLNPFLESEQTRCTNESQQNPFRENGICSTVGTPDKFQNRITSDAIAIPIQQTPLDSNPLGTRSFLESEQNETQQISLNVSQKSGFQQYEVSSSEGGTDGSENHHRFPRGLFSEQQEQPLLNHQSANTPTPQDQHCSVEDTDTISPGEKWVSHTSKKLDLLSQTDGSQCEHYCAENLEKHHTIPQQNSFMETTVRTGISTSYDEQSLSQCSLKDNSAPLEDKTQPYQYHTESLIGQQMMQIPSKQKDFDPDASLVESETDRVEREFNSLDSGEGESGPKLDNESIWTTFSLSEEALIFEMDTESESSSDSSAKFSSGPTSSSSEPKHENKDPYAYNADHDSLFPPLQIFSDIVDKTVKATGIGVLQKLPPPPRQAQRKRTNTPVCSNTEHAPINTVDNNVSESKQKGIMLEGKKPDETQSTLSRDEPLVEESEAHPVSGDEDLSATGNSISEIESDLLSDSKLVHNPCTSKVSDSSITEIICEEFESIEGKDGALVNEEVDGSNLDGDLAKASIHDDIAPLLMQGAEPIQYLNLGDLPENCQVLQKRPSSASSTDDSSTSSTSTDSSFSETEMPYAKLQEELSDTSEHG